MGYSNFKTLKQALKRLEIEEINCYLFESVVSVEPSNWLKESLEIGKKAPLTNEKSKSERIVSPILLEIMVAYPNEITLYSGEELPVDSERDLAGECDFLIAKHAFKNVMQAPIITLVEAKNGDRDYGKGQCLAQMYAAQVFNEQEGHPQKMIFGCAVTAAEWKFMKLVGKQVFIDLETYYLNQLPQILGVWHHIIKSYL